MTRVVGLLLLLLAACTKAGEDAVDEVATQGFARALAAAAAADPTQSAALLARGAFETVAPSMKCFERFGSAATGRARMEALFDCGLACTPDAVQSLKGKEPRTWMAGLSAACGPEHFAIDEAQAALLSPEWFLIHKIGEFAARHAKAASGSSKANLDKAMAGFELALPLPAVATGLYELAVAPEAVSVPIATRTYVLVPASGPVRVGATPHAKLQAIGAAIETPDKRAGFPGNQASAPDLRDRVLEAAGQEPEKKPPAPPDAGPAPASAPQGELERARAIADALTKNPEMFGKLDLVSGLPSGLHGEVRQALRGDLASDGAPVPLFLADGGRPAAEVIELAAELDRVLLAVASPDDPAARALTVELSSVMNSFGRGPGQAHVALAPGGLEAAKKAAGGSEETVVIRAEGQVPWRDAVAVAAVAVARGCKRLIFTSEKLDGSKGGGGTGVAPTGLLGHGAYGSGKPGGPVITDGLPTAKGNLDAGVIRRVIRSRMNAFRTCYQMELKRTPHLELTVELELTIGADGVVTRANASGAGGKALTDCLVRQVERAKFPAPAGGAVEVRYPLTFKPAE